MRRLLEAQSDWHVVGEAASGDEAVESALRLQPHVVILDIFMPRMDGLTAAQRIRETAGSVELLMISHHDSEQVIRQAFNAGARGFLAKVDIADDLIPAVKTVCARKHFLSRSVRHSVSLQ